jgi:hypothetical protein
VNRRQFLACSLSSAVASAALPWDPFVDWCKRWLGFVQKRAKSQLASFAALMKERYADSAIEDLLYAPSPLMQMLERA